MIQLLLFAVVALHAVYAGQPYSGCPYRECRMHCDYYMKDATGCDLCECAPHTPKPGCPGYMCLIGCEKYETDANGCDTCRRVY